MYLFAISDPDQSKSIFEAVAFTTLGLLSILVVVHLILRFLDRTPPEFRRKYRWSKWDKLVYFGFALIVCGLGATSFFSVLILNGMHGWWLVAHLVGAGGFVVLVAVMSLTVSIRFTFVNDLSPSNPDTASMGFPLSAKIIYWIILLLSIVVVGVILLSMFPFFGTDQLDQLIDVHRMSGLALFILVVLHILLVTWNRI